MTFEQAVCEAAHAVVDSEETLHPIEFEKHVKSLVVQPFDTVAYYAMSIDEWRHTVPHPRIVVCLLHHTSFGG